MKINREKALAAFQEYTDRYDSSRDMIRLKIEHTYRAVSYTHLDVYKRQAYILCDVLLSVVMLVMIWKRMLPLKNTAQRILASFCNPIVFTGIVGNLFTLLPWPLDQIDHGTESAGHLLVLILGQMCIRDRLKGCSSRTSVLKEIIYSLIMLKKPGNTPFPGLFLYPKFCLDCSVLMEFERKFMGL